jgi:hypothetical protein
MPVVEVTTHCEGVWSDAGAPGAPDSFALTWKELDKAARTLTGQSVHAMLPDLEFTDLPMLRARFELPERFLDGPGQARLRLDLAGIQSTMRVRLEPVLDPALRSVTPPSAVRSWTFETRTPIGVVAGAIHTSGSGMMIELSERGGGAERTPMGQPVTLHLPIEVW